MNAHDYLRKGQSKANSKDWTGAIADFSQAIALDPEFANAYNNRGSARRRQEDLAGAIADFSQAIALNPKLVSAYFSRGSIHHQQQDLVGAIEDLSQALALDKQKHAATYMRLANIRLQAKDFDGAIADFSNAIDRPCTSKQEQKAYKNRGIAKLNKGDLDNAIADFNQAIGKNDQDADAYTNRGIAKLAKGDLDDAIADFNQAVDKDRTDAYAYNNRGIAKLKKNQPNDAIADFNEAIKFADDYAYAYENRGTAKLNNNDWSGTLDDLDRANDLYRSDYSANLYCHIARQTAKEDKKSRQVFLQVTKAIVNLLDQAKHDLDEAENWPMHYTSFGALRSIIATGRFRLYDTDGMEDPGEGKFIFKRMDITDPNHPLIKLVEEKGAGSSEVFVGSLVTNSNNRLGDYLMWRTYGHNQQGAALAFSAFSTSSFSDILGKTMQAQQTKGSTGDPAKTPVAAEELILCRVYYGDEAEMQASLKQLGELLGHLDVAKLSQEAKAMLRMLLDAVRFLFKSAIFGREEEARLIVRRPLPGSDSSGAVVVKSEFRQGEFPRTYVECPREFRPETINLGAAVKRGDRCKRWIEDQQWVREKNPAIEIRCTEEDS